MIKWVKQIQEIEMEELFCPSVLIYDSSIDITALRENKPYRNIGHLLMNAKSVRDALRLCGAEEKILDGSASDYECFAAICTAMQYLVGHTVYDGVKRLLRDVFGVYEQLSPFNCDELWNTLNAIIEDNNVTPVYLLQQFNVESLSVRVSPFDELGINSNEVDFYPVTDLGDVISLVKSKENANDTLEDFISDIAKTFAESSSAVVFTLGIDYQFERMSRKHEVYDIYTSIRNGKCVPVSHQNGLITYVLTSLFGAFRENNVNVLTELTCPYELNRLLDYLALNGKLPTSMIVKAYDPNDVIPIALKHSFRNEYGLPSVIPSSADVLSLAKAFPIGMCIEFQDKITDHVTVGALLADRERIFDSLRSISDADADSIMIDITYGNVKNRMRI
jgi:hypothetical protein